MRNKYTAEMVLTLVDNASKSLKNSQAQVKKLQKILEDGDKKEGQQAQRRKKRLTEYEAAQKRVNDAIRAQNIDKHVAKLEKELIARGKLTNAITKQGKAQQRAAAQAVGAFAKSANATQKQVSTFSKLGSAAQKAFFIYETFVRIARTLKAVLVDPFAVAGKAASDFAGKLAEINTLFDKGVRDSSDRVATLGESIKQLSREMGLDLTKTAEAAYNAVSSGAVDSATAQSLLHNATKLSVAGLVETDVAMKALTTVSNSFGVSLGNTGRVGDLLFTTVQKGVTTMRELGPKIGRVAGVAAASGMNMEAMFSVLAAGTKVTGNTSRAVTGLSSAINLILKPGKEAREMVGEVNERLKGYKIELGSAGLQGDKMIKNLQSMAKAFKQGKLSADELAKIIPNQRAQAIVLGIVKSGATEVADIYKTMSDRGITAGAVQEALNKIMNTSTHQIKRYKSGLQGAQTALGGFFEKSGFTKGFFKGMADELENVIRAFVVQDDGIEDNAESWENWGRLVVRVVGMVALALKLVVQVVFTVLEAFETLFTTVQTGLMLAFESVFSRLPTFIHKTLVDSVISAVQTIRDLDFPGADKLRSWLGFDTDFGGGLGPLPFLEGMSASAGAELEQLKLNAGIQLKFIEERVNKAGKSITDTFDSIFTGLTVLTAGDLGKVETTLNKSIGLDNKTVGRKRPPPGAKDPFGLKGKDAKQAAAFLAELIAMQQSAFQEALKTPGGTPEIPTKGIDVATDKLEGLLFLMNNPVLQQQILSDMFIESADMPTTSQGLADIEQKIRNIVGVISKLGAEDLTKILSGGVEGANKILLEQQKKAVTAQEIIQKGVAATNKRNLARREKQDKADAKLVERAAKKDNKERQRALKDAERDLEQLASSLASTASSLGGQLFDDIMDKEVTVAQAWANLGNSILTAIIDWTLQYAVETAFREVLVNQETINYLANVQVRKGAELQAISEVALARKAALPDAQLGTFTQAVSGAGGAGGAGAAGAGGAAAGGTSVASSASGAASTAMLGALLSWLLILAAILAVAYAIFSGIKSARDEARERRKREDTYRAALGFGPRNGPRGFASGGLVTGGTSGIDSVPAMLMPGEFVLNRGVVDSIRKGKPPSTPGSYATGGMVTPNAGATQIVFAPQIQTLSLPTSVQNQRYLRDTVARTQARLSKSRVRVF